jgi:tol-pal system protein YbgF
MKSLVRTRILAAVAMILFVAPAGVPAHAVAKEIVELQTQVQQLLDMMQRLQSTMDTKFAVVQHLAEQTGDQANRMTEAVANLQKQLNTEEQSASGKSDAVSGQMQSLNDSVDELKSRIAKLDKSIQDLQTQLQQMQAPPAPGGAPGAAPEGQPGAQGAGGTPQSSQAPPLQDTYQSALRDFSAGRYPVAAGEFQDVIHYYPLDDLAGSAKFYLGEIAYQQQKYDEAVNQYNAVLEAFSGNAKAPAAQLHKGYSLLAMNKKDQGVRELRLLIQRYPQTPEARAARTKLNEIGVKINATTPAKKG